MRQLATVRRIEELIPIEGADLVQLARIDDWHCVVKKSEFKVGDLCIYFEIDSHLPVRPEFEHLRKNSFKRMGEREGFRIKTIKLRGHLSQGLALPVHLFFNDFIDSDEDDGQELSEYFYLGSDVSNLLDVQKYEAPIPTEIAGQVSGNFPGWIKKTDQRRCQNARHDIFVENADAKYEVSMKLDGTSFTGFVKEGKAGVCGRNWELKLDDPENENNRLVRMFKDSGLMDAMLSLGRDCVIQGELMGPGIQQNREKLLSHKLFVFDALNCLGERIPPTERYAIMDDLWSRGVKKDMVQHAPVLYKDVSMKDLGISNVGELLLFAEGASIFHPIREGLVFKRMDGKFSFKAISNKYLLKEED